MTEKERLETLMRHEGLSLSQFANEINIQGSTLSHIMNGRNNPSLDVVKRILDRFPSINPDWLIFGREPMRRQISKSQEIPSLFDMEEISNPEQTQQQQVPTEIKETSQQPINVQNNCKEITKVVIFYSDNTYEEIIK
jgi:transcriptional regulator with XRE-family HTH domain